jgi:hypothetical protein
VLEAAGIAGLHLDFILFTLQRVVFVRVKRSHSRITTPGELMVRYRCEIADLRKVPLTGGVSRELWVLLPWGAWQHFLIGDGSITEIPDENGNSTGARDHPAGAGNQQNPPAL